MELRWLKKELARLQVEQLPELDYGTSLGLKLNAAA
jgi:hypothetical protein